MTGSGRCAGLVLGWRVALNAAAVLTLSTAVAAQSLEEAARKEKERRQSQAGSSCKKFTDDDLAAYRRDTPEPAATPAPSNAGPTAAPSLPSPSSNESVNSTSAGHSMAEPEAYWRSRARATRQAVALLEAEIAGFGRKPG